MQNPISNAKNPLPKVGFFLSCLLDCSILYPPKKIKMSKPFTVRIIEYSKFVHEEAMIVGFYKNDKDCKCEVEQNVNVTVNAPAGEQGATGPTGPTGAPGVVNYSFSQPSSIFVPSPGLFTVTNAETSITTLSITLTQAAAVELKGSIGWSSPTFFSINMISPNLPELVIIWRIRRGVNGPVIWESRDGISNENGEQSLFSKSVFHVDASAGLGPVTYELTGQVDPISSPGSTAEINGPISFVGTAFPV